jgi:hypothetical protein
MAIIRMYNITREYVRDRPDTIFVFGDNMAKKGFGGQAKAMRGMPNAVGIPTKWSPNNTPDAYFCDNDLVKVAPSIEAAFDKIKIHMRQGHDVVIPAAGIGTGLADLSRRAPVIYRFIQDKLAKLERL